MEGTHIFVHSNETHHKSFSIYQDSNLQKLRKIECYRCKQNVYLYLGFVRVRSKNEFVCRGYCSTKPRKADKAVPSEI